MDFVDSSRKKMLNFVHLYGIVERLIFVIGPQLFNRFHFSSCSIVNKRKQR